MRQTFIVGLILTIIFSTSLWYGQTANICPAPIKYRVGEIDERFGLTVPEFKKVLFEAELIWENPTGRELFIYDEDANFTVNLIFDDRQQLVHTEEQWRSTLDRQEREGLAMMNKARELNKDYSAVKEKYDRQRRDYDLKLDRYNARVESYNKEGGAPPEIFEELQSEKAELAKALNNLSQAERGLNTLVSEINALGEKGNQMIEVYNKNVQEYNAIFGSLPEFTQGDFRRERINVYKFADLEELTRVITHEFGHALGIGHVEDDKSIMYYLMVEQTGPIILSDEDEKALVEVCGEGVEFSHSVRRIIRDLLSTFNI